MAYAIEIIHLTKNYGKARGITDLELNVNENEIFGFIGPNGAGKSTTIRTLLGLIKPTRGSAKVLGMDIVKNHTDILSKIGYIPSEASFYSSMRVRDIIKLSANLQKKDCSAEAKALCERFGLDTSRKVDELSLGNRKKVGIVCAFQHKPELYILDEPTSGLDPLMQNEFFSLVKERQNDGATIFLSSHVLAEIRKHCDRAGIIKEGRLIACDEVEKLSKTSARRVILRGVDKVPVLGNVADVKETPDGVSFLFGGEIKTLIDALQGLDIEDMSITEPELDEVFMHYYKDGGAENDIV